MKSARVVDAEGGALVGWADSNPFGKSPARGYPPTASDRSRSFDPGRHRPRKTQRL
jgi:hypothetical protein